MMKLIQSCLLCLAFAGISLHAEIITVAPEYEDRSQHILKELRCLVCQNQTLSDSSSDLANDLRIEVKEMLERGASDKEILKFMSDRYGDFVSMLDPGWWDFHTHNVVLRDAPSFRGAFRTSKWLVFLLSSCQGYHDAKR